MDVSIVIPAFNAEKTIDRTIEACLGQDFNGSREVIVIDDGSADNTGKIAQRYPVRYIYQENSGPASTRNQGWKASKGRFVCFTDSDCIPQRNWVEKLLRNYQGDEKVGAVGGSYLIANPSSLLATCIQEEITLRHLAMPREVRFLGSYNLSVRNSVLEETGGFDEGYRKASGEDNALSYKILKHGYKILFDREALVAHYHRESLGKYLRDQYTHGFWRARLYKEHPNMARGDDYTRWKDVLEVPMSLLTMSIIPLLLWAPGAGKIVVSLLLLNYLLQLGLAFRISCRTGRPACMLFSVVTLLRGFARTLGFTKGLWDVIIRWAGV